MRPAPSAPIRDGIEPGVRAESPVDVKCAVVEGLRYLTVQDILYINTQVAKTPQRFRALKLEEASFGQYGYGKSVDVERQAAGLLAGILRLRPFESANEATALVSCAAFLLLNGRRLDVDDAKAANWVLGVSNDAKAAGDKFAKAAQPAEETASHGFGIEEAIREALAAFPGSIRELAEATQGRAPAQASWE